MHCAYFATSNFPLSFFLLFSEGDFKQRRTVVGVEGPRQGDGCGPFEVLQPKGLGAHARNPLEQDVILHPHEIDQHVLVLLVCIKEEEKERAGKGEGRKSETFVMGKVLFVSCPSFLPSPPRLLYV